MIFSKRAAPRPPGRARHSSAASHPRGAVQSGKQGIVFAALHLLAFGQGILGNLEGPSHALATGQSLCPARSWLQGAELTEYDLSEMKKVRFELARKDASISLRLPAALLAMLRAHVAKANMPTQRLIRMMIETHLAEASAKSKWKRKAGHKRGACSAKRGA